MNTETQRQPILRRIVGWGAAMAALWGCVPFFIVALGLFFADFGMPIPGPGPPSNLVMNWGAQMAEAFLLSLLLTWPLFAGGALIGMASGLCASPLEPRNPLKSVFFRAVGAQTLLYWLFSLVALVAGFVLLNRFFTLNTIRFFVTRYSFGAPWIAMAGCILISFVLSLWRAINRALRATKAKQS